MSTTSLCPRFHRAIELIGGRWTGPIVQILLAGPCRFGTLREVIPHISDRMLSERLRELEAEGIVVRSVIPASPVRVEYSLSDKGRELRTALEAVSRWAERWIPAAPAEPPALVRRRPSRRATPGPRRRPARA